MDCFRCREPLWPSAEFTLKDEAGTRIVETEGCFNPECGDFGSEQYCHAPNLYVRVNRSVEGLSVQNIVKEMGLGLDRSIDLDVLVQESLQRFPEQVQQHRSGKKDLSGFLVGQIMRTNPSVDPKALREAIVRFLTLV